MVLSVGESGGVKLKLVIVLVIVLLASGAVVSATVMRRRDVTFGGTVVENKISWYVDPGIENIDNILVPDNGEVHFWIRFKNHTAENQNLALYATAMDVTGNNLWTGLYDAGENVDNTKEWFTAQELPFLPENVWGLSYYHQLYISAGPYQDYHDADESSLENLGVAENVVKVVISDVTEKPGARWTNLEIYLDNINMGT